jgi:glutamine synthetase
VTPSFSTEDAERAVARKEVTEWLETLGTRIVHLGVFDASGVLREKALTPAAAARALEQDWSFIDAIQWWGPDDRLRPGASSGAMSHPAAVDLRSARTYPFGPEGSLLFLAEFAEPLNQLSPRHQVDRMIGRAAELGLSARVGWEFECIVLQKELQPTMGDNRCWSASTMAAEADRIARLIDRLEAGEVPVDHVCAELGPGCLEIALGPQSALRSADSAALAKIYTRAHYTDQGERATFMAQLGEGFPGLGGHPSLSLHSTIDGSPVLVDEPGALSKVGRAAIAGVVQLLPDLLAMVAPTPNSYRRFGPGNWAPTTPTWGMGNYSCSLRVVADDPDTARLELRAGGADISPHQCLAMLLGAVIWGIEHDLDPPSPVDPANDGRVRQGGRRLPRDLTEASERLSASAAGRELFGDAFVDHLVETGVAEAAACHRFVSDQERDRYLAHV